VTLDSKYQELGFHISSEKILSDELLSILDQGANEILSGNYDTGFQPYSCSWKAGKKSAENENAEENPNQDMFE